MEHQAAKLLDAVRAAKCTAHDSYRNENALCLEGRYFEWRISFDYAHNDTPK